MLALCLMLLATYYAGIIGGSLITAFYGTDINPPQLRVHLKVQGRAPLQIGHPPPPSPCPPPAHPTPYKHHP